MFLIPAEEYPACLYLLAFDTPDLLMGDTASRTGGRKMGVNTRMFRNTIPLLKAKYGIAGPLGLPMIDQHVFSRALAKIGYAYICRQARHGAFTSIITDFILGREPFEAHSRYVGGELTNTPTTDAETLHTLSAEVVGVGDQMFIVARIQLFSNLGAPVYRVVVGTTSDPTMSSLQTAR